MTSDSNYNGEDAKADTKKDGVGGRRPLLDAELSARICEAARSMYFISSVAELVGVRRQRIHDWLARGESELRRAETGKPPKSPYAEMYIAFLVGYRKATAEAEAELLAVVREGRPGWQACAWILERSRPERYALVDRRREAELLARIEELEASVSPKRKGRG